MRWSRSFFPTLREAPADAESVSHKLMIRAGLLRKLAAGIYSLLPLGSPLTFKPHNFSPRATPTSEYPRI